ncbi:hypothetical protein ACWKT5_31025 [Streptomyces avermitilis]
MASTPVHTADSLLSALDPLPYPRRMRELALRVRAMSPLRPVLEARGAYERGIAVVAASVARDAPWIAEHIADADPFVRGHALGVADSLQVPDTVYESALGDACEAVRRDLLRAIVVGRRTALADRLVDGLRRDRGDAEAARLLPGRAPETVARLLPGLFHAVIGWKTLAKRHPRVVLDAAEQALATLPEALRAPWWSRYMPAVAATVTAEPLRALALLERLGPETMQPRLRKHLGDFAAADPGRLLRLLLTPAWHAVRRYRGLGPGVLRTLARSGAPELATYGKVLADDGELTPLLRALPPAQRHSFYVAAHEGRGAGVVTVDAVVLEALPRSCVAEEARRMAEAARESGGPANDRSPSCAPPPCASPRWTCPSPTASATPAWSATSPPRTTPTRRPSRSTHWPAGPPGRRMRRRFSPRPRRT